MTLGDRVVVMRGGAVQQVGAPQFLYDHPANLFVAGFIGSPSMNFVPAGLENGTLRSPLGDVPLTDRIRQLLEGADAPRDVIVGIRPEHFEDVNLVEEHARGKGHTFTGNVDVLESMGSDKFAYVTLSGEQATSQELAELAADAGSADLSASGVPLVTRISATSTAKEGRPAEIWFNADKVQLFDPKSGRNLTYTED
jgi:multiple sugar transport system ATP-binding protein